MNRIVALSLLFAFLLAQPAGVTSGSRPDLVWSDDVRAIHMGGNWGLTSLNDWGVHPPSHDYLGFLDRVHASWVGISVALHLDGSLDSTVDLNYTTAEIKTFTDEALTIMIDTLHQHGFKVYLTLAFDYDRSTEYPVYRWELGDPVAPSYDPEILPQNWPWAIGHPLYATFVPEFFQTYTNQAVHFATLAETTGVEMFSLGTETERLFRTRSGGSWPNHFLPQLSAMAAAVRAVYSGLLTYDMHFDALRYPTFFGPGSDYLWQDLGLDVVGISAYFPLVDSMPGSVMSVAQLETCWQPVFTDYLEPLQTRNPLKPILFLEFGYVNNIQSPYQPNYGEFEPWVFEDEDGNGLDDSQETQANIYQAFFNVNDQHAKLVKGAFLWGHDWGSDPDWAISFGAMHTFAVRGRLAERVVRGEYGSGKSWLYVPVARVR